MPKGVGAEEGGAQALRSTHASGNLYYKKN